jgi:hypothetical protein
VSRPQRNRNNEPLDPAVISLVDALARAMAREDDERERSASKPAKEKRPDQ